MRKVLLTTTALVALGGASAASALDVSGNYSFDYINADNGSSMTGGQNSTSFGSDAQVVISGSTTTDSGLTFGGSYKINHSASVEDQGLYISGDFGYAMMGATDGVVDGMISPILGSDIIDLGAGTVGSAVAGLNGDTTIGDEGSASRVGYRSPSISGLQVGFSMSDAGTASKADVTAYGVTYNMDMFTVGYAASSIPNSTGTGADVDSTVYGIGAEMNGITLAWSAGTETTAGASGAADTSKINTTDLGVSYSGIDSVTLWYNLVNSEEKKGSNAGDKLDSNAFGVAYSIADGVSLMVEQTNSDYTDAGATASDTLDTTKMSLTVNF
jgi:hypothetical protein